LPKPNSAFVHVDVELRVADLSGAAKALPRYCDFAKQDGACDMVVIGVKLYQLSHLAAAIKERRAISFALLIACTNLRG